MGKINNLQMEQLNQIFEYIILPNLTMSPQEKQDEAVEIQTLSDTIDLSDVVEEIKDEEDVKKA